MPSNAWCPQRALTAASAMFVSCVIAAPAGAQHAASFPIEPGLTWTYRGHIRWTGPDQRVHTDSITWTMKIVALRSGPNARAALVRGWVQDLAWHTPLKPPAYSALVLRDGRLYHVAASDSAGAAEVHESAAREGAPSPPLSALVLDSTLVTGSVYGRDSVTRQRNDNMYGWHVVSDNTVVAQTAWRVRNPRVRRVTLEYRTLSDRQTIDVVPGVGITRFVYSHHGSVADTDVQLVSVTK